jgi:hypothetical protein
MKRRLWSDLCGLARMAVVAVILAGVLACDRDANESTEARETDPAPEHSHAIDERSEDGVALPPLWRAEGLLRQVRLDELARRIPPDLGWEPAATSWQPARRAVPQALLTDGAPSPGALLYQLVGQWHWADSLGIDVWEHTLRIHLADDDHASGAILAWGMQDDSLAGSDLRVEMQRDGAVWRIVAVEERHHCARGVTDDDLCR